MRAQTRTIVFGIVASTAVVLAAVLVLTFEVRSAGPSGAGRSPRKREAQLETPAEQDRFEIQAQQETPQDTPSFVDIADCLESLTYAGFKDCLLIHSVHALAPDKVAAWLCDRAQGERREYCVFVGAYLLETSAPDRALEVVDEYYRRCGAWKQFALFCACLELLRTENPTWFAAFKSGCTPDRIFSESLTDFPVLLISELATDNDYDIRQLITSGALGMYGGTPEQRDRALGAAMKFAGTNNTAFELVDRVLGSNQGRNHGMGCSLAHCLCLSWLTGSNPYLAQYYLQRVLSDLRFQSGAARQLLSMRNRPEHFDEAFWSRIIALAGDTVASH